MPSILSSSTATTYSMIPRGPQGTLAMILAKAGSAFGSPAHEGHGETVFRHACKLGLEALSRAQGFRLPLRPLPRLAQNEELGCTAVRREAKRTGRERWR